MFTKHVHYSQELEHAILGACLLEQTAFGRVYDLLEPETFYLTAHQETFSAMKFMFDNGLPIDTLTVIDQLIRIRGAKEFYGYDVAYFVCMLTNHVVSSAHLEYHSYIVKSMWIEREILRITHGGVKLEGNPRDQIKRLQEELFKLQTGTIKSEWQDMTELMVGLYQNQAEFKKSGGLGITSGIKKIDKENGGFFNGQMIVIGARPSMGKSAMAGKIAIAMAQKGTTVGIISLEMSNHEIAGRLAALDANIDFNATFRGLYKDEAEKHRLYERIGSHTAQLPIYVSDKTGVNINEIRSKAAKLKATKKMGCLIIDYLQLISTPNDKYKNRENEVAAISRGCKIMAKEMDIPVILLCQLNREVTKRKGHDRYPHLSDLRESGAIEQDADAVMFLHRDWMIGILENQDGSSTEREADLVIRKWRNGLSNWIIKFDFDPPKMKFTERTDQMKLIEVEVDQEAPF